MLPTFVIGLREGLEGSLIIGIIAAFLRQQNRPDALRRVWLGVGAAVLLCIALGGAVYALNGELSSGQQSAQEALETVIGLVAVAMISYMVVWMKRNSRGLRASLEGALNTALQSGSSTALVGMAFLAVLREGIETVIFLLAAFDESTNPQATGAGAALGVAVAFGLGYAIYRGGVRLNLSRFFRATGVVLVFVAAGLLATAAHTAHEAGWLNTGQTQLFDFSAVINARDVLSSLLTGMLGIQAQPVVIEVVAYLVYLVPMVAFVVWPARKRPRSAGAALPTNKSSRSPVAA